MKVIGLEVRLGVRSVGWKREAKVIPFELAIPEELAAYPWGPRVELELTVHTTQGDVTISGELPRDPPREGQTLTLDDKRIRAALDELARRVEAIA